VRGRLIPGLLREGASRSTPRFRSVDRTIACRVALVVTCAGIAVSAGPLCPERQFLPTRFFRQVRRSLDSLPDHNCALALTASLLRQFAQLASPDLGTDRAIQRQSASTASSQPLWQRQRRRPLLSQVQRPHVATTYAGRRQSRLEHALSEARWWRNQRLAILRRFVTRTEHQRWSPALFRLLVDELVQSDDFDKLIGPLDSVPKYRYPQVIAVALAVRFSYREDLLRRFMARVRGSRRSRQRPRQASRIR
jgi:hypothetical protein